MTRDSQTLLKIDMTPNYLLLTCIDTILCVSLEDIETVNAQLVNGRTYIERFHEKNLIKAKVINMSEMFDSDTIEAGLFVKEVNKAQLKIVERVKDRKNVI